MIETGDAANVIQALSLAEAIGLIQIIKFKDLVPQGHPYATHSYSFMPQTTSFMVKLAKMQGRVSKGFHRGKSDIHLSVYRTNECHIFVNQR